MTNKPDTIDQETFNRFVAYRQARGKPLTPTALAKLVSQAAKANMTTAEAMQMCMTNNWIGFRASWVNKHTKKIRISRPRDDEYEGEL